LISVEEVFEIRDSKIPFTAEEENIASKFLFIGKKLDRTQLKEILKRAVIN